MEICSKPNKPFIVDEATWVQCSGVLPFVPDVNSRVYYFPQGHLESMFISSQQSSINEARPFLCEIVKISYLADAYTEEMYSNITLKPIREDETVLDKFHIRNDLDDDFFGKEIFQTHIDDRLFIPVANNGIIEGFNGNSLTLVDVANKKWSVKCKFSTSKNGYNLSGNWNTMCQEKKIAAGDTVFFTRTGDGDDLSVSFRKKGNFSAFAYTHSRSQKRFKKEVSKAVARAQSDSTFKVRFYPNWVDFLVDPDFLFNSNKNLMTSDLKIQKRNSSKLFGNLRTGKLSEAVSAVDDLSWRAAQVIWDNDGSQILVNSWDVVPSD
ncbi:auxin response factor 9-like [Vicia villosa]|uniref:auxin response factor 9-like n=1 Tax=Vicia villosa TaxID=3911 RepID=UPI00273B5634|nr:auxin response factor 9-like [Vicia villosa]